MVKAPRIYPRVDPEKLGFYSKLADALGLLALYPFIALVAYWLSNVVLFAAAESYLVLLAAFFSYAVLRGRLTGRDVAASLLSVIGAALIVVAYTASSVIPLAEMLVMAGKLLVFVVPGLYVHDLAKKLGMGNMLDKYGGLIVLGSLILVVRNELFILAGLLLLALGLGGASGEIRRLYYANYKALTRED